MDRAVRLGVLTLGGLCGLLVEVLHRWVVLFLARMQSFLAQPLPHHSHMHVEPVPCHLVVKGQTAQFDLPPISGT